LGKGVGDSTSITDFVDLTASKELSDGVAFLDGNTLQIVKAISDGIGLDDAALVNKNYFGNKGNTVGVSDLINITITQSNVIGRKPLNIMSFN
jgi:hypothetical protein